MEGAALLGELREVHAAVAAYFETLPLPDVYRRRGDAWAPLDDLRHLTLSTDALTRAFALPPEVMEARFGAPAGASRSREEVARLADAGLAAGGRATEALTPLRTAPEEEDGAFRDACVAAWRVAARRLEEAAAGLGEGRLDAHQLPHPFLGMLTLREWLHFNVVHALHHIQVAERRRAGG